MDQPMWLATALINRGDAGLIAGRWDEATDYLEEGIGVSREHGIATGIAVGMIDLATASFQLGRDDDAASHAIECLEAGSDVSDMAAIALLILAGIHVRRGDLAGAGRRLGGSEAIRAVTGYDLEPTEQAVLATVMRELGDEADDRAFRAARDEGRALDTEAATALVSEG
jgi:ATP/maltotriose-dependent transcriptional regulator MalT